MRVRFGPLFGAEGVWVGGKGFHFYGRLNAGLLTGQVRRLVALTREEAEDLWAEARDVRRGWGAKQEH